VLVEMVEVMVEPSVLISETRVVVPMITPPAPPSVPVTEGVAALELESDPVLEPPLVVGLSVATMVVVGEAVAEAVLLGRPVIVIPESRQYWAP